MPALSPSLVETVQPLFDAIQSLIKPIKSLINPSGDYGIRYHAGR